MCHLKRLCRCHKLKKRLGGIFVVIGNRIKRYRMNNNYSQKDLANILGVSTRSIVRWEQGKNKPNADELKKLSTLLCVDEDELINDSDNNDEDLLDDEPSVLDRISEGVENLVTGQETINDTLLSTKNIYCSKQDQIIENLKKQNEQLLLKLEEQSNVIATYKEEIDTFRLDKHHKQIRTIAIIITCLIFIAILLGTWIFWMNNSYQVNDDVIEGSAGEGTPSYFIIDEEK